MSFFTTIFTKPNQTKPNQTKHSLVCGGDICAGMSQTITDHLIPFKQKKYAHDNASNSA